MEQPHPPRGNDPTGNKRNVNVMYSETQLGKQRTRIARQELVSVADQPNSVPPAHVHSTAVLPFTTVPLLSPHKRPCLSHTLHEMLSW